MKILLALVLSLVLATAAHSAPVTFAFTGVINSAPISGSYTFESTAPFNDNFIQAGGRVAFQGGGWLFSPFPLGVGQPITTAAQSITAATVHWQNQAASIDGASVVPWEPRYGSSGITASNATYAATVHVQGLTGYDYFGLAVEGPLDVSQRLTQVPTVPPSLNGSPAPLARLELFNLSTGAFLQGPLSSLNLVPNPIPSTVWLFGSALLLGLGLRAWRAA